MSRRIDRINELLREEISQLLSRQIKDPRLNGVISITEVRTSPDMRNARVSLSVLGDQPTQERALAGIRSAATFLRRELQGRLTLRHVPFMSFHLDNSMETADRVLRLLNRVQETLPQEPLPAGPAPEEGQLAGSLAQHGSSAAPQSD
jgi:ribosome-binding factor A